MRAQRWSPDRGLESHKSRTLNRGTRALAALGFFALMIFAFLAAVPHGAAAYSTAGGPLDPVGGTIYFIVFLIGVLVIVMLPIVSYGTRAINAKHVGVGMAIGAVIMVAAFILPSFTAPSTACVANGVGCTAAPPTATLASQVVTGSLPSFVTCNTITFTCTVPLEYNSTAVALYVAPKVGFTGSGSNAKEACGSSTACKTFVNLPFKLSRTDTFNNTYGFNGAVNGIPTLLSTGSNPTAFSPIGYTTSSSTSPGVWQFQWSAGSLKSTFPSNNAPTITTGVGACTFGILGFGSVQPTIGFTLGGTNSTSATFGTLATNFTSYPMQVAFSGGGGVTPPVWTINFVEVGWTA